MTYAKEKITDNAIPVFQNNEVNKRKLEIEIKVILKSCCFRYKRRLSNCCDKFKDFFKCFCKQLLYVVSLIIGSVLAFLFFGGWFVIFVLISKKNNSNNSNN